MGNKYLIFTLTMPHAASWNNKWSGDGRKYVRARKYTTAQLNHLPNIINKDFRYRWDDGWEANINVTLVKSSKDKDKLIEGSVGFYGYDWMIDSIVKYGKITRFDPEDEEELNHIKTMIERMRNE